MILSTFSPSTIVYNLIKNNHTRGKLTLNSKLLKAMKLNYKDRLGRKDFIIAIILSQIVAWVPIYILWAIIKLIDTIFGFMFSASGGLSLFFIVAPFIISGLLSLSVLIRRHHDLNQSWMIPIVVGFVLLVLSAVDKSIGGLMSFIYFLYLALSKSVEEGNKYGKLTSYKNVWEKIGIIK